MNKYEIMFIIKATTEESNIKKYGILNSIIYNMH